ncbi:hypothetical protein [Reyranella sp.]|uniref:hypothetical protein n=1 Tax=Reyranella sp. TaxID=1929291 RepID=UPI0027287F95|nr:hypothetical protein [Reyranella sp.]MDO8976751.1 hypothetical protein [Reyranella sp.]
MSKQSLGDAPIEPRYFEEMNTLARELDQRFNHGALPIRHTGFVLLVFPFGNHDGRCNYISNADREDVIVLLKEQLARFQGMPEAKGRA